MSSINKGKSDERKKKERGKRKKERGRRKVSKDANEEGDTIDECYNTNNCNV